MRGLTDLAGYFSQCRSVRCPFLFLYPAVQRARAKKSFLSHSHKYYMLWPWQGSHYNLNKHLWAVIISSELCCSQHQFTHHEEFRLGPECVLNAAIITHELLVLLNSHLCNAQYGFWLWHVWRRDFSLLACALFLTSSDHECVLFGLLGKSMCILGTTIS